VRFLDRLGNLFSRRFVVEGRLRLPIDLYPVAVQDRAALSCPRLRHFIVGLLFGRHLDS